MKRGIDHLVICVSDLEQAINFYRRLGFTTTPRAEHPWGTDNSLVQLNNCFLELLTLSRPELTPAASEHSFSFGAYNKNFLSHRQGMSMLAFESNDAGADREEFVARGLYPYDNFHFERSATLPDGSRAKVGFTLAFATDPRMPDAVFFCCQQHAPQYFWRSEYQSHANGATSIAEVLMLATEPLVFMDFFSKIQEPDNVTLTSNQLTVNTPRGAITMLKPEDALARCGNLDLDVYPESPCFLGYVIHVPDLEHLVSHLRSNDVPFEATTDSIRVGPTDALGICIEFRGSISAPQ